MLCSTTCNSFNLEINRATETHKNDALRNVQNSANAHHSFHVSGGSNKRQRIQALARSPHMHAVNNTSIRSKFNSCFQEKGTTSVCLGSPALWLFGKKGSALLLVALQVNPEVPFCYRSTQATATLFRHYARHKMTMARN